MGCCCSNDLTCPKCKGNGSIPVDHKTVTCDNCRGVGSVTINIDCNKCSATGYVRCSKCKGSKKKCTKCNGEGAEICEACNGIGSNKKEKKFYNKTKQCEKCNGTGVPLCKICNGTGQNSKKEECRKCDGTKRIKIPILKKCTNCQGTGTMETTKTNQQETEL